MVLDSDKVRRKIESIQDLPTLPSVAREIIAMAQSPKTNASDVGKMIEKDQALMGKVLKLVNSSFYGFPGQIKSIQHAVVIIGFNKVKNVVMTASVFDLSKGRKANLLDMPGHWEHSLGTAIGAQIAARAIGGSLQPEDAFVGGLIHGLGKLILDQYLSDEYQTVRDIIEEKKCLINEAEKEHLGFTYSTVGTWISEKWKLPSLLHNAIRFHLTPMKAREDREIVAAVHIGNILSRALGVGNPGDDRMPQIDPALWSYYNLSYKFLDESIATMIEELQKAQDFFDMIER
ncbi:MAG: HDOD domain-containing protein [Planctomycetes bacterium]|nr:HDOD domain-containing protein [Planctomycetota bacterium]